MTHDNVIQFVHYAHILLGGAPGSKEQYEANAWLCLFQSSPLAYDVALQILSDHQADGIALIALQILRHKIAKEWSLLENTQQYHIRNEILSALAATIRNQPQSTPRFRVLCITLSEIIVKSFQEWNDWRQDVEKIVNESSVNGNDMGMLLLLEILGAIPNHIASVVKNQELDKILVIRHFQQSIGEVLHVVHFLTQSRKLIDASLNCLENWLKGCIPCEEEFGIGIFELHDSSLVTIFLDIIVYGTEDQSKLAGEVLSDVLSASPSKTFSGEERLKKISEVMLFIAERLSSLKDYLINHQYSTESIGVEIICAGLSKVSCALALHHSFYLFSEVWQGQMKGDNSDFTIKFLELILFFSEYPSLEIMLPTLEFWYFFLELDVCGASNQSMKFLDQKQNKREVILQILKRLVVALVSQACFPPWFIDSQEITSDDPDYEDLVLIRREVADTLQNVFAHWPEGRHWCIDSLVNSFASSNEIATLDVLLFVLDYSIELFDSTSPDDDDDLTTDRRVLPMRLRSLQTLLLGADHVPPHPLLIKGVLRLYSSVSSIFTLEPNVCIEVAKCALKGMQTESVRGLCAKSLVSLAFPICKTDQLGRFLESYISIYSTLDASANTGAMVDLVEGIFILTNGIGIIDYQRVLSLVFPDLLNLGICQDMKHAELRICQIDRAMCRTLSMDHLHPFIDHVWNPLLGFISMHHNKENIRKSSISLFKTFASEKNIPPEIYLDLMTKSLTWYCEGFEPELLPLLMVFIEKDPKQQQSHTRHLIEITWTAYMRKMSFPVDMSLDVWIDRIVLILASKYAEAAVEESICFLRFASSLIRNCGSCLLNNENIHIYEQLLKLCCVFLQTDSKVQLLLEETCKTLLFASGGIIHNQCSLQMLERSAQSILLGILSFLSSKHCLYKVRCVWDLLFDLLHGLKVSDDIKGIFAAHLSAGLMERNDVCENLLQLRHRAKFRQYLNSLIVKP